MFFWENRRVVVTGGAGLLGSHIVARLKQLGCREVSVPRRRDYDLCTLDAIGRLLNDNVPDIIIHAAGLVGGIGANHARPAEFFYNDLIMGVQLLRVVEAWLAEVCDHRYGLRIPQVQPYSVS